MKREQSVLSEHSPSRTRSGESLVQGRDLEEESGRVHLEETRKLNLLRAAWRGWLKFAEVPGTNQMFIILTLMYWTILAAVAIPFRFLADPLVLRGPRQSNWVHRQPGGDILDAMKKQS